MTKKLVSMFGFSMALAFGAAFADPPDGPPPPGHGHRPPEAAFTACASLAEGDACTAEVHGKTETGKCVKVPARITEDAGKLFCGLPHPPPPRE
jgi:hypothetical protein